MQGLVSFTDSHSIAYNPYTYMLDGDTNTFWDSSTWELGAWVRVDLGIESPINTIFLLYTDLATNELCPFFVNAPMYGYYNDVCDQHNPITYIPNQCYFVYYGWKASVFTNTVDDLTSATACATDVFLDGPISCPVTARYIWLQVSSFTSVETYPIAIKEWRVYAEPEIGQHVTLAELSLSTAVVTHGNLMRLVGLTQDADIWDNVYMLFPNGIIPTVILTLRDITSVTQVTLKAPKVGMYTISV